MKKDKKVSDTTVTHSEGVVVAVGPQSTDKEYPITVRSSDGEYYKVWHDASLRRGTSVTIDQVIWANGWKDTFIVTC